MPSYHDVHVKTPKMERTSIFDLPFQYKLICQRAAGWTLWNGDTLVGAEYGEVHQRLDIDVAGHVILNALERAATIGPILRRAVVHTQSMVYTFSWSIKDGIREEDKITTTKDEIVVNTLNDSRIFGRRLVTRLETVME
jgi:hypothetical protein